MYHVCEWYGIVMIIQENEMIEGNEDEVTEHVEEAIIHDFHKRLDRLRISVAALSLSGYTMWWLVMKTDRFLRIKRDGFFFFLSHETREGVDSRPLIRF